jgi:hypothetical protein
VDPNFIFEFLRSILLFSKFSPKFCFKTLYPYFQCFLQIYPFYFLIFLQIFPYEFYTPTNFYTDLLYLNIFVHVYVLYTIFVFEQII